MIDAVGKIVIGVLTVAVCAGCSILWDISSTMVRIESTLIHIQDESGRHELQLDKHREHLGNHEIRLIKLENK